MKPCKYAYKQVRDNSNEIFKDFGFKHLSDATQYIMYTLQTCPTTVFPPFASQKAKALSFWRR
ncbi:MAG: hypothetical protein LIO69_05895 [Oscillospiraceae bacterium]|nr:hypothetical protein [Oscillospiraceae bacterium]